MKYKPINPGVIPGMLLYLFLIMNVQAQNLNTFTNETIIYYGFYDLHIDSTHHKSIKEIIALPEKAFKIIADHDKQTKKNEVYWLRFRISNISDKSIVLETPRNYRIDELYIPESTGYQKVVFDIYKFWGYNQYIFNNPSFALPPQPGSQYFYLRLSSDINIGLGFVLYESEFAHNKAIKKFTQIFLLIGVILLAFFYAAIFYLRMKDRTFLFYLLYLFSLMFFSLTQFGATYPLFKSFDFSYSIITIPYVAMTIFLILYIDQVLGLKEEMPKIHLLMYILAGSRIALLFIGILWNIEWTLNPYLDYGCLVPAYLASIASLRRQSTYVRLLFISLTLIFTAFTFRTIFKTYIPISDYELGQDNDLLFFIFTTLEVILLSFTLAERFIQLKKEKEQSHIETIHYQQIALSESQEKEKLKEMLNKELETMVAQRTVELRKANEQLKEQAEEIDQINNMLKTDNEKLSVHVENLHHARMLDRNMSFDEFKEIFPDEEKSYGFVAGLKWKNGFECKKCGYKKFYEGYTPHSRKCKLCRYTESATANTLFDNVKFSLQKALYILYYTYSTPAPNIHKLSETIDLREATCYNFSKKVSDIIGKLKPSVRSNSDWTQMINIGTD